MADKKKLINVKLVESILGGLKLPEEVRVKLNAAEEKGKFGGGAPRVPDAPAPQGIKSPVSGASVLIVTSDGKHSGFYKYPEGMTFQLYFKSVKKAAK